jgi:hypothetical protein
VPKSLSPIRLGNDLRFFDLPRAPLSAKFVYEVRAQRTTRPRAIFASAKANSIQFRDQS